jgi:4-amino-4-deoxy-L-arabinose transferase-like glycosyltransferase
MAIVRRVPASWLTVPILLLAMGLRFHALDGQSLWADEGNSVVLARAGLAEIAVRTAQDIHPPFYYWLLHGWTRVCGETVSALRSLSAFADLLLVAVVIRLGRRLLGRRAAWIGGLAAAVSPFQIYYAQETRMYALLALLGGLTVWPAAEMMCVGRPLRRLWPLLFVVSAAVGLYTHYAFPVILAATAIGWLAALRRARQPGRRRLLWLACHALPIVAFLPWLPTALHQLTTWPAPPPAEPMLVLGTIWRTLTAGPAGAGQPPVWLIASGLLGLAGLIRLAWRRSPDAVGNPPRSGLLLGLYLGLPVALTAALFKPAYLKFLLVASPAWCLLLGAALAAPRSVGLRRCALGAAAGLAGGAIIVLAAVGPLTAYFTDSHVARDDYRGLSRYLEAVAGAGDAVVLNAPGQQEVFGYYYRGSAPVYPLPRARPPDSAASVAELEAIVARSRHIYAVYWASEESDPQHVIESWLGRYALPATQWWVGNLRVALYAAPLPAGDWTAADARFGDDMRLVSYRVTVPSHASGGEAVQPGDVVQMELRWQADVALPNDFVAFVQLVDATGHVVGQRDSSPLESGRQWLAGEPVVDRHGLLVLPGTPPGDHRLITGLYDAHTGVRLPVSATGTLASDHLQLTTVRVVPPDEPPAPAALRPRYALSLPAGPFRLLGADCFKLGHDSSAGEPLTPGDPLHVVLYWQSEVPPERNWLVDVQLMLRGGGDAVATATLPLAGVEYPTQRWRAGEVVRAQYDLWLPASTPAGDYIVQVQLLPADDQSAPAPVTVCPVRVRAPDLAEAGS